MNIYVSELLLANLVEGRVRATQPAAVALTAPAVASKAISACVVPEALDKVTVQYKQITWTIAAISEFAKAKALSVKQAFVRKVQPTITIC